MEFIDENISQYAEKYSEKESELLGELNRETWANVLIPRMLSGHMQGRILSMISKIHKPQTILEIGTYTGYSALCLAEGLRGGGRLHTIDINEELEEMVNRYIVKANMEDSITMHVGNAMDIIPKFKEEIDLVFIDADKENYSNYFDLVIDKMPSGGLLIADNVLWSGKVLDQNEIESDMETKALHEFSKKIHADGRVENVLFPVRDGLMVVRKK
jgi:caffeoyl-CoA O-methyltransferase